MNSQTPTVHRQHILFAVVLLLLGQLVSSLHNHEVFQPSLDADDCVICLIGNAGTDASPIAPKLTVSYFGLSVFFTIVKNSTINTSFTSTNHSRAPPYFS
jgi:hypothetical protein